MLFASFLFLAGCGSNETEEPADDGTEGVEETEDDASDASVDDKEGTGADEEAETDTEGTDSESESDSEGDTSGEESTEETEDTTGEDRGSEDSDRDDSAENEESDEETDESESEEGTEEEDSSDASSSETDTDSADSEDSLTSDSDSDVTGESEPVGINFDVTEETVTGLDGTEMTSMFELNSGIGALLDSAEESDAAVEDILMAKEDVSTYYAETFMVINVFTGDSDQPADSDSVGLTAEIDESDEFEILSGMYDQAQDTIVPYAYANTDSLFVYESGMWNDYTGQADPEEVYYASYSNLYDAFVDSADVMNVSEDDEYYYLHNIGTEEALHDTFGTLFNVQFTNADLEQQKNGVVGVVDKESNELLKIAYLSYAPGVTEGEELYIEVSSILDNYGEFDDGITVPQGIYE
ncbi:hypothetical protein BN1048_00657 [Jeotgalicoccus saudimassiliensis]|uniref:Uncharacterized protein n=1 Tax=Jeotgalicoccus saudimassiliensis TaxID=1461582 RepID=A0A078M3H1_9STAP|nr:hypothetical protein [Jeotgalicoccus saudimassiliensis]CDZ99792.1 hypothetical protein BN1048_00657 [Jeotgalicoccus saudimassiliensis]